MKILLLCLICTTFLSIITPALAWGDDCKYSREIKREASLASSSNIIVAAGAGALKIEGDKKRTTALIHAKLCSKDESQLADMNVSSGLESDALRIETVFAKDKLWNLGNNDASIDLVVYVPASAELNVNDSSGEAHVSGVASLDMVDSSGELTIEGIAGDVKVKDSSGSLSIDEVAGSVWVTDSSGGIEVANVIGNFTVEVDSSGSIEANNIGENVLVRVDSSGSIGVSDVGGDFIVGKDSSGGIRHENVSGEIRLPE